MYIPERFDESRLAAQHDLIEHHPFGVLVTHGPGGLDANHLPFVLARDDGPLGALHAHVARANPVWRELRDGDAVMVVFRAAHAYVSPSWYPSKHEHHRQVPTWNYQVVHAHGRIAVRDDAKFVRGVIGRLTKHHEAAEAVPWRMADTAPAFLDELVTKIVGLELAITRLDGKSKLGQNKDARDILGASDALAARGHAEVAAAMRAAADDKHR